MGDGMIERVADAIATVLRDAAPGWNDAQVAHDAARAAVAVVVAAAEYEVDKALENGVPRDRWDSGDIAQDHAREEAIGAIRSLCGEKE